MESKLDPEKMFDSLCKKISSVGPRWKENKPPWKPLVFECFHDLAEGRYRVNYSGSRDGKEWLFDLNWTEGDPRGEDFKSLVLALECEWGWDVSTWQLWKVKILEDFHKLLVASCPTKVFVYSTRKVTKDQSEVKPALNLIRDTVRRCERLGKDNLLVILLSPPRTTEGSCTANGLVYEEGKTEPIELEPQDC